MKILEAVPYFYPAWAYGGPAKLVYDTCQYFVDQGHQVTVFTSDAYDEHKRMPESLRIKKTKQLNIIYFRNIFNRLTYKYNIFCAPGLFLRTIWLVPQVDVIHLHDFYTPHNLWMAIVAAILYKPYVISVHGCLEAERIAQRSLFKKVFLAGGGRWLLQNAEKVIATSENEVAAYLDYGVKNERITFLGHGINPAEFQSKLTRDEARKSWNLPMKDIVITFLGRIHKIKGLDLLVQAISLIPSKRVTFIIAGTDDGYLDELNKLIKKIQVKNITLFGACFGTRKADLFKASDVFVYPSYSEGFSLGILEAGAAGLPLVITTGCHFEEVEKTGSGLVVQPNANDLAKALQRMIESPIIRRTSSQQIRKLITQKYSMATIGNTLLEIYQSVLKKQVAS